MKRAALCLAVLLLGSPVAAQTETRIPPDPMVIVGVAQEILPGQANAVPRDLVAVRGVSSSHVRLVDASTGELRRDLWLPPETRLDIMPALSQDGRWLAVLLTDDTANKSGRVGIVNLQLGIPSTATKPVTFQSVLMAGGLQGTISLAFSPDGSRLATGNKNAYVQLWDWQGGTRITTIQSESRGVPAALLFSPDGNLFAPMFRGQVKTRLFDSRSGDLRNTLAGVGVGQFGPDNKTFLASRGRFVNLSDGKETASQLYLKGAASVIGFSFDGTRVLVRRAAPDEQGREWLELRETLLGRTLGAVTRIPDGWPEFLNPAGTALLGGDGLGGVRILPIAPR